MAYRALTPRSILAASAILLGASLADFGQQAAQSTDKKEQPKKEPAPLFGGKMGIKSSSNTKETASLGFNGIDPSGKVDAKMLAATPSAADETKAKQLTAMVPNAESLATFLREGGLKAK